MESRKRPSECTRKYLKEKARILSKCKAAHDLNASTSSLVSEQTVTIQRQSTSIVCESEVNDTTGTIHETIIGAGGRVRRPTSGLQSRTKGQRSSFATKLYRTNLLSATSANGRDSRPVSYIHTHKRKQT